MGVELVRVLVMNLVQPILLITFTNHALDHMLLAIRSKITDSIVRLGGRMTEEAIRPYTLEATGRVGDTTALGLYRHPRADNRRLKELEEKIGNELDRLGISNATVPSSILVEYLRHV